ncbi:MAG: hypothetical protein K6G87_16085 [Butyrivibrio sp.]|uniref:hypothetical protein n=1 Tax=Butyrivibrio sp. TaxID=28121 RepID=UPI0025D00A6F|nr:hypothetical protein [Butyrivibrio sp.]MCR5772741.1 hypothetical protein [Butyrivibrio sp.]
MEEVKEYGSVKVYAIYESDTEYLACVCDLYNEWDPFLTDFSYVAIDKNDISKRRKGDFDEEIWESNNKPKIIYKEA